MNMRSLRLIAACLSISACATARVDLKYAPTDAVEPLRMSRMPRLLISDIEDRSPGFSYAGVGGTPSGKLTSPLLDSARDAVRLELTRLGIPLADSRDKSDAVLRAFVTAANATIEASFSPKVKATFSMGFQLRSLTGDLLWSNELVGQGVQPVAIPGFPGDGVNLAMNAAMRSAMLKLRRTFEDEGVLERVFRGFGPVGPPVAAVQIAPPPGERALPVTDLDQLPSATAARPRSHAIVIGIERYRENLPKADFAARDAKLTAEYFKRVLGVPAENLALLVDDRATNVDFQKYFERWLPNRVKEGDEVFIYFSGHGSPNPAKGDAYLVPYDGDPTYIEQTGYSVKRMYDHLAQLPAKRVVVAMDSCFSGAGGRSVLAKGARPLVSLQTAEVPTRITVLSASAGDQISNSYQEKGHGLFTYYFLKGLKEKGADFRAVYGYLKPEVARVAREQYNADQDPQWRGGK